MERQGSPNPTDPDPNDWDDSHAPPPQDDAPPMPPIQGVYDLANDSPNGPPLVAGQIDPWDAEPTPTNAATDPWGLDDSAPPPQTRPEVIPLLFEIPTPPEPEPEQPDLDESVSPPRKGGGTLTIPLLCAGIAVIACTTLLPLADDIHRHAWEREKLKQDLAHLKEQVRVNDDFLHRVADDPSLAERLAQRQMRYIRQGSTVLNLKGQAFNQEMSPFHLVAVPPPRALPPYHPIGGFIATLVRHPRTQLYLNGGAFLLIAAGLVLGYVPRK
jgi:hypothetical protein